MAALQKSEVDWVENSIGDMLPPLRNVGSITVEIRDPTGLMGGMRLNQLARPFNNPAIRRAMLKAVSQQDFCIACVGEDPSLWRVPTGIFCPQSPYEVFLGKRDYDAARQEIEAAGYKGEKVVLLAPTDVPVPKAQADVCGDMRKRSAWTSTSR